MRKSEVSGVVKILESADEYESAEDAAKAIIKWLDEDRIKRTSYVAVMQFGERWPCYYVGLGPYPGKTSARNAATKHPAAGEAYKIVVVPVTPPDAVVDLVRNLDTYTKPA